MQLLVYCMLVVSTLDNKNVVPVPQATHRPHHIKSRALRACVNSFLLVYVWWKANARLGSIY